MTALFKKLNYKNQKEILILNPSDSFGSELKRIEEITTVKTKIAKRKKIEFILAFVTKQSEIEKLAPVLTELIDGDGILWFAYPKGTSKNYKCDFNRDTGWDNLRKKGFESVRMIAIDQDWSALRFRRVEFIKSLN